MKKKYFFFDIDGTLTVRETGVMVPSALEAVRKLEAAGHFVSIATGRAFYKAVPFARKHDFSNMVCNGGHGIYIGGELKENRPMEYEPSLALYREAIEKGYGVLVALDDSKKVYARDFTFIEQVGIRREPTTYIIDDTFDPADYPEIFKMYFSVTEEQEKGLTHLKDLGHLRFVPQYMMCQPDEKLDGIFRMLELVGGDPENVVVFGDDVNDLVMFDPRFYCVAMGNGHPLLKEKADYIAPAPAEDGIFRTCQAHGWF